MENENAAGTEQKAEAATLTPSDLKDAVILKQEDGEAVSKPTNQYKPFFEEEVSDADLMGEPGESKKAGDDSADTGRQDKGKDPEKGKEAEKPKKEDGEVKADEKKDAKPPEGYVPKQALSEEREKRKQAQAELALLRQQIEKKADPKDEAAKEQDFRKLYGLPDDFPEDFKVLTAKELRDLTEEDVFAGLAYRDNLAAYKEARAAYDQTQNVKKEMAGKTANIVSEAISRMETSIPGIHDEKSEVNKSLTDFAVEHGFDADYLNALTDPQTMFLPSGAKQPMLLGNGAAAVAEFIHNLFKAMKERTDDTAMRAKLEKEITERVTGEVMKKVKTAGNASFTSLGDAPGSIDIAKSKFNEVDFAKMSPEEQRAALGG